MSTNIEWAEIRNAPTRLDPPGEITDPFGNENDQYALCPSGSIAIEGTPEQFIVWARKLIDHCQLLIDATVDGDPDQTD